MKAWISPTFCLLPASTGGTAAGVEVEARDELLEVRMVDAAAQVGEVGEDLAAGQVGVERGSPGR